jgi:cytochrome c553
MRNRAALLLLSLVASPVSADFDAESYPPYERCALCHGLFGVSANGRFPNLAGQEPVYIETQIHAFLDGTRHNDRGQMAAVVSELKPEEVPVVVEWFSTQDPPEPTGMLEPAGAKAFEDRNCAMCHDTGTAFLGVPHLTAQQPEYLVKQMTDFRDGARDTHAGCLPHAGLIPQDDAEIAAIAAYLAATPRPQETDP